MPEFNGAVVAAQQADPPKVNTDVPSVVEGNNDFAFDMYSRLRLENDNIVFSPYSIVTALAMTYGGARGETAEEMAKVLHFKLAQERLHPAFGQLAADLQSGKDRPYHLYVANSLFGQRGFPFAPPFLELTRKNYQGGFHEVDFIGETDQARKTINGWVETQTREKIKDLLKPGVLSANMRFGPDQCSLFQGNLGNAFSEGGNQGRRLCKNAGGDVYGTDDVDRQRTFQLLRSGRLPMAGTSLPG